MKKKTYILFKVHYELCKVLKCLGQMDPASPVFDFLYLGSEWNASNLEVSLSDPFHFYTDPFPWIPNADPIPNPTILFSFYTFFLAKI